MNQSEKNKALWAKIGKVLLITVGLATLIKAQPFSIGYNSTSSMPVGFYALETINADYSELNRGDIVSFKVTNKPLWMLGRYFHPKINLLKEIKGVSGDYVTTSNDFTYICKTSPCSDKNKTYKLYTPAVDSKGLKMDRLDFKDFKIPYGAYYLGGSPSDSKTISLSSSYYGLIGVDAIEQKGFKL